MSYEPYPSQPDPAQYGYGATFPQAYVAPVKDLSLFGTLSIVCAATYAGSNLVNAIAVAPAIEADEVGTSLVAYVVAGLVNSVALLCGFVTTGIWLFTARKNSEAISPDWSHERTRGWAWGGWVTPVVWWWFPLQVVRDVYRATTRSFQPAPYIGVWWGLWITLHLVNFASSLVENDSFENPENAAGATVFAWVLFIVSTLAALAWARTVHGITKLQHDWMRGVVRT